MKENNVESSNGRNPLPNQAPRVPPPPPPTKAVEKAPTFTTLKNIVMDSETLTAEQKLELIDKISNLYHTDN
jgi:hypothetical protein